MEQNGTEWCREWYRVVQSGTEWYGSEWFRMVQSGTEWYGVVQCGTEWYRVLQSGAEVVSSLASLNPPDWFVPLALLVLNLA